MTLSKENWSAKENIVVSGYSIYGSVVTSSGEPLPNIKVQLLFTDEASAKKIDTKKFVCEQSVKSGLEICQVTTDAAGRFTFMNVAYGKYRLVASAAMDNGRIKFHMQPREGLLVDLTNHRDSVVTEQFKLDRVSIDAQALFNKNVSLLFFFFFS